MKKILFTCLLIFLIFFFFSAINIEVEKISSNEVLIPEVNRPAIFDLRITNHGSGENFIFYSFFGSGLEPKGTVFIGQGATKEIKLKIYPRTDIKYSGLVIFDLFIKSPSGEKKESLTVNVMELKDALEIGTEEIDPTKEKIKVYIKNKVNFDFGEISVKLSSPFFEEEEKFNLSPKEIKEFEFSLDKERFKGLTAGFYTLKVEIFINGQKKEIEGRIKFEEKDIITTTEKEFGFGITTYIIKKTNEGNIISTPQISLDKNIISRLFTTFSIKPDFVERKGAKVYYSWVREIKPGETLEIKIKTNWFYPFLAVILIVTVIFLVRKFSKEDVILRKKITFVKSKGGEFALKVSIFVNAKKHVERVTIVDRIPPLVKIHEKFGVERPKKIDEKNRKIEWYFDRLESGENRVISYLVYSKIGVVGKFALPPAIAIYERDGEIEETKSNRAFFLAEQKVID